MLLPALLASAALYVPLGDPAYGRLEVLCAADLTGALCPESVPISRALLVGWVRHARATVDDGPPAGEAVLASLEALETELSGDLEYGQKPRLSRSFELFARRADLPILDGENGARLGLARGEAGFDPTHPAMRATLRGEASWKAFAVAAMLDGRAELPADGGEPVPRPTPLAVSGQASLGFSEATVSVGSRYLGLRLGRQSLDWGPTDRGGLVLSDGAPPLDALWLGSLEAWHGFTVELFQVRVTSTRGQPWLFLQRIGYSPASWLSLGAQRAIECCPIGSGASLGDVPTVLFSTSYAPNGPLAIDGWASWDFSVALPAALSRKLGLAARVYAETGGAGVATDGIPQFLDQGDVRGMTLSSGAWVFRYERGDVSPNRANFYSTTRYPQGDGWLGAGLGYPPGGRSSTDLVRLTRAFSTAFSAGLLWQQERYDIHLPLTGERDRAGVFLQGLRRRSLLSLSVDGLRERRPGFAPTEGLSLRFAVSE